MQVAIVALVLVASAIKPCIAGHPRALRASTPPFSHEVPWQEATASQRAAAVHDEHHPDAHRHKLAAKISLMTIASEREPTTVHRGGPHHDTTEERSPFNKVRLSKVEQHGAHVLHAEHRRGSRTNVASRDGASDAKMSEDVVVHVDADDAAVKATGESHVAAKIDSSVDGDTSAAGAIAYDSDATDGSEAFAEGRSSKVGAAEDRGATAIYHAIAKTHAEDNAEMADFANIVDSAESGAETEATANSKNVDISNVASTAEGEADSQDAAGSEEVADSGDDVDSADKTAEGASENVIDSEDTADSEVVANSDVEDMEDSEIASSDSEIESDSKAADVEVTVESAIATRSDGTANTNAGSDSEVSSDVARGHSTTDVSAAAEKDGARDGEAQPDANSTVADEGLPGQVPGHDGEVTPESASSDEGDGARTEPGSDPGSLNVGSSVMQAEAVGPADSYHDGATESEDWGKEYGRAAQAFHDQVESGERSSSAPHRGTTAADGGGSGTMALVVGLVIILGLLACALGLGAKI